jgi:hypothetical protein
MPMSSPGLRFAGRGWLATLLGIVLLRGTASGGLILEADPSIDSRSIRDLAVSRGNLVVRYHSPGLKPSVIRLPTGALERVALWAASDSEGPVVVSVDSVFVKFLKHTGPRTGIWLPPYIEESLGDALLNYDLFAANLAVGFLPKQAGVEHPLVKRKGSAAGLPSNQYRQLMDLRNQSPAAIWYRRLASEYLSPPGCPEEGTILAVIGEHTIRAVPSGSEGLPVRLQVVSHRWMVPARWYRGINVPSEWDRWVAALPFEPLRRDMEEHWDDYRATFPPIDEISSIVECFGLLRAVHRQNEPLWQRFRDRLLQGMGQEEEGDEAYEAPPLVTRDLTMETLTPPALPSRKDWLDLNLRSLQPEIRTSTQANLALALMWKRSLPEDMHADTRAQVEALAQQDEVLRARLTLVDALTADPKEDTLRETRRFFDSTRGRPDLYRLRGQAIHMLSARASETDSRLTMLKRWSVWPSLNSWAGELSERTAELRRVLGAEGKALLEEFRRDVSDRLARVSSTRADLTVWEELSQNVYSDDLLRLALQEGGGDVDPQLLRYLVEIHYHRGKAPQIGMELAYRHANFRFLKHLSVFAEDDAELRDKIHTYRAHLAELMGLKGWETAGGRP